MELFGISIPIVQLAGGLMICRMGWQLLTTEDAIKSSKETAQPERKAGDIENILFYPVSFPMTTGAGTISVLLTLSAHGEDNDISKHLVKLVALFIAVLLICLLIYICYANTPRLIKRLGPRGEQIVNRLSAFLVFCIGMQIASAGIRTLLKT
jgi:multiple antibiotic resistance protein